MKLFLLKAGVLMALILVSFVAYMFAFADGSADGYYHRFTTGTKPSLIVGTSQAAQGVFPSILDSSALRHARPMYNFAFSGSISPYGPTYLQAILRRMDPAVTDGLFVVCVSPQAVSEPAEPVPGQPEFPEEGSFLGRLHTFTADPNFEYLLRFFGQPYYKIGMNHLVAALHGRVFGDKDFGVVEVDGRLHIHASLAPDRVKKRRDRKLGEYSEHWFRSIRLSEHRMHWLATTVDTLQRHGRVVMVRLPEDPVILAREQASFPDFDARMRAMARQHAVPYVDLTPFSASVKTTDGIHLASTSGAEMTRVLIDSLLHEERMP